ncbi:hypothetical protein JW865_02405 [Candidatus Bathyarchaeota archaeon]|nr:hypothetical protein [Candidatus Bathyarchaeota archaeon]
MNKYIDLHLKQPIDVFEAKQMVDLAEILGYSGVALAVDNNSKIFKIESKIDIITRLNLSCTTQKQLLDSLNKYRKKFEIISVQSLTKEVARQAAKDHRVDILTFPRDPLLRKNVWLDYRVASLAGDSTCSYEINFFDLINKKILANSVLNIIKKEVLNAKKRKIPIILASGASEALEMREPKALTSILNLIDVSEEEAKKMITINPANIIKLNRMKLSSKFVQPGVRRV